MVNWYSFIFLTAVVGSNQMLKEQQHEVAIKTLYAVSVYDEQAQHPYTNTVTTFQKALEWIAKFPNRKNAIIKPIR